MKKTYIIILLLMCVSVLTVSAQDKPVDINRQKAMAAKINKIAASLNTMQCTFVQTKHLSLMKDVMVSEGKMYYRHGQYLRWEYTSPYTYIFVLNGSKVTMKSSNSKSVVDVRQSRLFQEIANIMMSSVTGKCLSDTKNFNVTMSVSGNEWIAELIPLKKEMKQMFNRICLHFNSVKSMISSIEMYEKKGDRTVIRLDNIKTNVAIDEKVFVVN